MSHKLWLDLSRGNEIFSEWNHSNVETSNVIQFYSYFIPKWDYQRFQTRWRDSGSPKIRRVFKMKISSISLVNKGKFWKPVQAKTIIRDAEKKAQQNVAIVHRERRNYLRGVLKEALLILEDEPGLIAPQALLVFELLSYSRQVFTDQQVRRDCWGRSVKC